MSQKMGLLHFLLVLLPYLGLLVYVGRVYPGLPERFSSGVPRFALLGVVGIAGLLPLTYGVLLFGFRKYLKQVYSLPLGLLMAGALILLGYVVHLMQG